MPIKKLIIHKFNKIKNQKLHNDKKIINFFKIYKQPAPPVLIAEATGLSKSKVSQVLKSLMKYKIVKLAYRRKIPFYVLTRG
jgi:predicted transcriptional regulator